MTRTHASSSSMDTSTPTVVVSRLVGWRRKAEFDEWADRIDQAASDFPGHLASIRLQQDDGINHLIYQFATHRELQAWERSAHRERLIEEANEHSVEHRQRVSTRAASDAQVSVTVPNSNNVPKWRRFLLTWLAVYPSLLIIASAVKVIAPGVPNPLQLLINSAVLTALLTWVLLPRALSRFRMWLLRPAMGRRAPRQSIDEG